MSMKNSSNNIWIFFVHCDFFSLFYGSIDSQFWGIDSWCNGNKNLILCLSVDRVFMCSLGQCVYSWLPLSLVPYEVWLFAPPTQISPLTHHICRCASRHPLVPSRARNSLVTSPCLWQRNNFPHSPSMRLIQPSIVVASWSQRIDPATFQFEAQPLNHFAFMEPVTWYCQLWVI